MTGKGSLLSFLFSRGLALLAALGVAACQGQPSATLEAARITELTTEAVGVTFDVRVHNRRDVPLRVSGAEGSLASAAVSDGRTFLRVAGSPSGTILPQSSVVVPLSGRLVYSSLPAGVGPGAEIAYQADLRLQLTLNSNNERLDLPVITHHATLPVLATPEVRIKSVSWTSSSWEGVTGVVTLSIRNINTFALGPGTLAGRLILQKQDFMSADKELCTFTTPMGAKIAGATSGDVTVRASFRPKDFFDSANWAVLAAALGDPQRLRVQGTISAATAYAPVMLVFDTQ